MVSIIARLGIGEALVRFQDGQDDAFNCLWANFGSEAMVEAVRVLEFGAKKYKAWNWAKGMAWSVPTGCIIRHTTALQTGEINDPESGLPHMGHIICNIMMLAYYVDHYPEGDDRPPS